jgi:hypothetical protein
LFDVPVVPDMLELFKLFSSELGDDAGASAAALAPFFWATFLG